MGIKREGEILGKGVREIHPKNYGSAQCRARQSAEPMEHTSWVAGRTAVVALSAKLPGDQRRSIDGLQALERCSPELGSADGVPDNLAALRQPWPERHRAPVER